MMQAAVPAWSLGWGGRDPRDEMENTRIAAAELVAVRTQNEGCSLLPTSRRRAVAACDSAACCVLASPVCTVREKMKFLISQRSAEC